MNKRSTVSDREDLDIDAQKQYGILDTINDSSFHRITRLTAASLNAEVAIISIIDENQISFKSAYGLNMKQIPSSIRALNQSNGLPLNGMDGADLMTLTHRAVANKMGLEFYAALPLKTSNGYLIGTLCVMDKLPRLLTEQQFLLLRDYRDMIMELFELRLAANNSASQQRNLLNIAVHDLKNPLANISIRAQLIERKKNDSSAVTELANQIREASNQIIAQVSKLLDTGRELSESPSYYKQVNLDVLIRKVAAYSTALANFKGQQITLDITPNLKVVGDELQLTEVIDNLISNAIKYCFQGGKISIKLHQRSDLIIISVSDNGPGFSEEDYSRMFKRFARLSAKPTGQENSSGLGLSIVRQFVEQHGGRVYSVLKPKGTGAQMIVELPAITG